jgi:hypothetical protein
LKIKAKEKNEEKKEKTGKNKVLPRRIEISTYLHKIEIARVLEVGDRNCRFANPPNFSDCFFAIKNLSAPLTSSFKKPTFVGRGLAY